MKKTWQEKYFELLNNHVYIGEDGYRWTGCLAVWKQLLDIQSEMMGTIVYLTLSVDDEEFSILASEDKPQDFDRETAIGRLYKYSDLGANLGIILDKLETALRWAEYTGEEEVK